MSFRISPTCACILARAYYGLDLTGGSEGSKRQGRQVSIKNCIAVQWIDADHRITDQGLWELRRALSSPPNRVRAR